MKKHLLSIAVLSLLAAAASPASAQEDYQPSPEIVAAQEQFRENRFGIFIHWGIYSMYGQGEGVQQDGRGFLSCGLRCG